MRFAQESEGEELCTTPETSDYQISATSSFMSSNGPSEEKVEEMVPFQESVYGLNEEAETDMRSGDENDMRRGDGNDKLETINEN